MKQVWVNFFHRDIIGQNLPYAPYWKDTDNLDASQLEKSLVHSLKLHNRIHKQAPPLSIPLHLTRSVTWVQLIHSQWLLVASSDDISSSICLWSVETLLSGISLEPLAEAFLSGPVSNGAVDIDGSFVTIALELRSR